MNNQEIFDKVAKHLIDQGKQSFREEPVNPDPDTHYGLMYKAPDGTSCAVGCLIPDDLYKSDFEGEMVVVVTKVNPSNNNYKQSLNPVFKDVWDRLEITEDSTGLLLDLQATHDNVGPYEWAFELGELAERHNLTTEVLTDNA